MGSVAERIFRQSPVPVLTLGPRLRRPVHGESPHHIVAAVDFTSASAQAVSFAISLARENHARLTLLHVLDPKKFDHVPDKDKDNAKRSVEQRLAELARRHGKDFHCAVQVEVGRVVPSILQTLDRVDADLLVIGVHQSRGLLDRLMFPHAYELVCESSCPVLTLRETSRLEHVN